MKKMIIIAVLLTAAVSASAQVFDISSNAGRIEAGFTVGQAGSTTQYAGFGIGVDLLFSGFYLDYLKVNPEHKFDHTISDTKWEDTSVFCINAGYQIPVLDWLRIMPLAGYCQTNEGITDGTSLHVQYDDATRTLYHTYKVTPGSRIHHFNYGGGISIQPCKWFSINGVFTRYAIYGGISFNLVAFANR